jgi:hypothetical protein
MAAEVYPPQEGAASLIEKETNEHRTSNVQRPTLNNVFCLFKKNRARQIYPLKFDSSEPFGCELQAEQLVAGYGSAF